MKNYIVLYRVDEEAIKAMAAFSQEDQQESMKQWYAWRDGLDENLVNMGSVFFGGELIKSDGSTSPSGQGILGYSIIQADDLDNAKQLVKNHPHIKWHKGSSIEIQQLMNM